MITDPDIIAWHCDLVAEAMNSIAFQAAATSRFFAHGDRRAGSEAYARVVAIFKEFVVPEMKTIRAFESDAAMTGEAAEEWRSDRPTRRRASPKLAPTNEPSSRPVEVARPVS